MPSTNHYRLRTKKDQSKKAQSQPAHSSGLRVYFSEDLIQNLAALIEPELWGKQNQVLFHQISYTFLCQNYQRQVHYFTLEGRKYITWCTGLCQLSSSPDRKKNLLYNIAVESDKKNDIYAYRSYANDDASQSFVSAETLINVWKVSPNSIPEETYWGRIPHLFAGNLPPPMQFNKTLWKKVYAAVATEFYPQLCKPKQRNKHLATNEFTMNEKYEIRCQVARRVEEARQHGTQLIPQGFVKKDVRPHIEMALPIDIEDPHQQGRPGKICIIFQRVEDRKRNCHWKPKAVLTASMAYRNCRLVQSLAWNPWFCDAVKKETLSIGSSSPLNTFSVPSSPLISFTLPRILDASPANSIVSSPYLSSTASYRSYSESPCPTVDTQLSCSKESLLSVSPPPRFSLEPEHDMRKAEAPPYYVPWPKTVNNITPAAAAASTTTFQQLLKYSLQHASTTLETSLSSALVMPSKPQNPNGSTLGMGRQQMISHQKVSQQQQSVAMKQPPQPNDLLLISLQSIQQILNQQQQVPSNNILPKGSFVSVGSINCPLLVPLQAIRN